MDEKHEGFMFWNKIIVQAEIGLTLKVCDNIAFYAKGSVFLDFWPFRVLISRNYEIMGLYTEGTLAHYIAFAVN